MRVFSVYRAGHALRAHNTRTHFQWSYLEETCIEEGCKARSPVGRYTLLMARFRAQDAAVAVCDAGCSRPWSGVGLVLPALPGMKLPECCGGQRRERTSGPRRGLAACLYYDELTSGK